MGGVAASWQHLWRWVATFFAGPRKDSVESPSPNQPDSKSGRGNRNFCRVLDPVDPWLDEASSDELLSEKFKGKHDKMSVACVDACAPTRVLASFYGSASYIIPAFPHYFPFTESEARDAGADLEPEAAEPDWPPEYSNAHHNLLGDQPAIARQMVALHRAQKRSTNVARFDVLDDICGLLARPNVEPIFKKNGQKHVRRLLKLPVEMFESWLPLAEKHPHILDDQTCQQALRDLNEKNVEEWQKYADRLPRLETDQRFRSTKK